MIDLHCHILPGVDDGSPDAEISLSMARHAAESGVTAIAVTPHCNLPGFRRNYRGPDYRRQLNDLRELLTQENIPLRLYSGAEVFADPSNIRTLIEQHELITLGGSRYLLVEFDFGLPGSVLLRTLEAIAQRGLVPVVAHPERYDAVQRDPGLAAWCFSRGMLLQLNKGSLLGLLGQPCGGHRPAPALARSGASHRERRPRRPLPHNGLPVASAGARAHMPPRLYRAAPARKSPQDPA